MYSEEELRFPDFKEHAQEKGMWAGSQINTEHSYFIKNSEGIFVKKDVVYSAAMLKYYDEIIVNALDQYTRSVNATIEFGGPVTELSFSFDVKTGMFTAKNNGPGIQVMKRADLNGKYSVEGIITKPFGGTNHGNDVDKVTGGVNGVGLKIVCANSVYFEVETVDMKRKIYYKQTFRNCMDNIDEPIVIDLSKNADNVSKKLARDLTVEQKSAHTTFKFILNFENVCKDQIDRKNPNWFNPEHADLINQLLEFRIQQVALFVCSTTYRFQKDEKIIYTPSKVSVYFNNKRVKINDISSFAKQIGINESVQVCLEGSRFPWHICFGDNISRAENAGENWALVDPNKLMQKLQEEHLSLINGVHVSLKTNHLKPIYNQLSESLHSKAEALLKTNYTKDAFTKLLSKLIYIVDCRQVPVQQLFNSQTKDTMTLSRQMLDEWKKDYKIPEKTINLVWKMIEPKLEYLILTKKSTKPKKAKFIRKYTKAAYAGVRNGKNCTLLIPEGDSAAKPIEDILKSSKHGLGMDYYGIYNIQGVPPNALKETTIKMVGGRKIIQKSVKLQENVAFGGLVDAVNLNYDFHYDTTDEGEKQFATLHYGAIIVAVDQDLDGIGQIFSLIAVFIARFWPNLIKRGFLKRFATPIIRVYGPNGKVYEFFSNREFLEWKDKILSEKSLDSENKKSKNKKKKNDSDDEFESDDSSSDESDELIDIGGSVVKLPSAYEVKYYKGLATHTDEEVFHMGQTFWDNVFTYLWDENAENAMDIYFGESSDKRKDVLSTPVNIDYDPVLYKKRKIKLSEHFLIEAKAQKLDFVLRKLKHSLDGLIPAQRKAFAGARKAFAKSKKPQKVYQITGRITTDMCYQHGDTSMNDTITKMAQNYTGAYNLPLFISISNGFGDRTKDRGITGSARYIETVLNTRLTNLLFPLEDDFLLDYVFEEGKQCEPKYYVPIVPYSIIESLQTPSAGWAITTWGRDFNKVCQELRDMINWNYPNPAGKPSSLGKFFWKKPGMTIDISKVGGSKNVSEVCIGSYRYTPETRELVITQLPPQVWSKYLVCRLTGVDPKTGKDTIGNKKLEPDPLVVSAQDLTTNDEVCIKITLAEGAYEFISENYGSEFIDPFEEYFEIAKSLRYNINMILADNSVKTFSDYESVLEYWFSHRYKLYETRLTRKQLLLEFEIDYYKNILRFIEMDSIGEINIDKKPQNERITLLEKANFVKFNKTKLFKPLYLATDKLHEVIYGESATYSYIDAITVGQKSSKNIEKLKSKIEKLTLKLEQLKNQKVSDLWISELNELEKVVDAGLKTRWLFTTKKHTFVKN